MIDLNNNKEYDVGIVGYWWSTNYGSVATYYALYRIIEELNLRPVLIDKPMSSTTGEGMNVFSRDFMQEYCSISCSYDWDKTDDYNNLCDTFIIGSDQVWTSTSIKGYNYFFFLDFVNDKNRKISYAASFGETFNVEETVTNNVSKYLKRFSGVSVRERQAVEICNNQLDVNAEWVMDPVFLLDKQEYYEIAKKSKRKVTDILKSDQKYLLTYILNPSEEKRLIITKIAEQMKLPIICILDGRKGTFDENNQILSMENTIKNVTEEEWLYFFQNADYIVTDSQHGSAFSIIFNKQFVCCSNKKWGQSRFESLFGLLGLKNRQKITCDDILASNVLNQPINYDVINSILSERVKDSYEWLIKNLGLDSNKYKVNTVTKIYDDGRCSGCSACESVCPKNAISMKENKRGFLYPSVNIGKCILCGLCLKKCINEHPDRSNNQDPKCFAMMADDNVRMISSSGGMFTVAAEHIIDNGGVVCGAAFTDDFQVEHIIVDNKEDLYKLRGSKYMQSHMKNVYSEVKNILDAGKKVLFTGMPCQVAGIKAFLGNDNENLYTIDLLCHGITSSKVFEKYHAEVLENKKITDLQFKAKKPWGWHAGVNAIFDDESKYSVPLQTDPYFIAYLKSISKNRACENCQSNALPRQGDLSIGDFWGIPKNDPEMHDRKGTSVVIVNNEKGEKFFDSLKSKMKKWKEEPLQYAINNNKVIIKPYQLHKNHDLFFSNFNSLKFDDLTDACFNNRLYEYQKMSLLKYVPEHDHELFYIAQTAVKYSQGRKIITWIKTPDFERVLNKYFGVNVEFSIAKTVGAINNKDTHSIEIIDGASAKYYIVAIQPSYTEEMYSIMEQYGYSEYKDFIFRKHRPIMIENIDLSTDSYFDSYGNTIEGFSGIISKITFYGGNNHIILRNGIKHTDNLLFELASNSTVTISEKCNFTDKVKIETRGFGGKSEINIGANCKFMDAEFRVFNSRYNSKILINDDCTFGNGIEFHTNSGKKIIIGQDCMFSRDIDLWAGDGHSIFDVNSGKNINSVYEELTPDRNQIFIGDHVWIAKGAFIMHGTNIGNGSIVGAKSVIKGVYPNNCSIAGNPAKLIKRDIAWSREMSTADIAKCGERYVSKTVNAPSPISGLNVLVVGGTKIMGQQLVKELVRLGNCVTIATRGKHPDDFGIDINRIILDVSDEKSVKRALSGKKYDVVFDNLAYCSIYANNILSNVDCKRYIQLSSVEAYKELQMNIEESLFDPYNIDFVMCLKKDVGYIEGKRQGEALVYQKFPNIPSVTVRLPYVIPTSRMNYYCQSIIKGKPMNIKDLNRCFTFIRDTDVGKFLPWIAAQDFCGPINFSSEGFVTIKSIIEYVEQKTGKKAVLSNDANLPQEPFTVFDENSYSINVDKLKSLGYQPPVLEKWFWNALDSYIEMRK